MKPRILAGGTHHGAVQAIAPVLAYLQDNDLAHLEILGHPLTSHLYDNFNLPHTKLTLDNYSESDVLQLFEQSFHGETPDLVLTGTSDQSDAYHSLLEHHLVENAKKYSLPTVGVLDFYRNYVERFKNRDEKSINDSYLPDYIAIMDEFAKKDMVDLGFDQERLIITGNPHYDKFPRLRSQFTFEKHEEIRKSLGFSTDTNLIFYTGNARKEMIEKHGYWDLDNLETITQAMHVLRAEHNMDVGLVYNLHPRMIQSEVEEINNFLDFTKLPIQRMSHPTMPNNLTYSTTDLMLASDITALAFSTGAFEAAHLKKTIISLQPHSKQENPLKILTDAGIIAYADDPKFGFQQVIALARRPELRTLYLAKTEDMASDGRASQRVANLLLDQYGR